MKNILTAMILLTLYVTGCTPAQNENVTVSITDTAQLIKRGDYLVNSMGCQDCHSPKAMGPHGPEIIPDRAFSGFQASGQLPEIDTNSIKKGWILFASDLTAAAGPWGVSFAGNISGDETGIGNWSEENFRRVLREGKFKGLENGRDILPPMPWQVFKNFTDEDIKAIYLYLKSTKPVNNVVPPPVPFENISNTNLILAQRNQE